MNKRVNLKITGIVQGVFYRVKTREKAQELGLTGWIMNIKDGSVEIVVEGEEDKIKELINWCKISSPGNPEKIQEDWQEFIGEFKKFNIKY